MSAPVWKGSAGLFHVVESGALTAGDRVLLVDVYRGTYANALAGVLLRGTYGTGARAGHVVTESVVDSERGGVGKLTIRWEPGGIYADPNLLPSDDFDIQAIELFPKIERNPFFDGIEPWAVSLAYAAAFGPTAPKREEDLENIDIYVQVGDPQGPLMRKLVTMWQRGEETYYLAGLQYVHILHAFVPPALSVGGFVDTPTGPMAGLLPTNFDWLRKADIIKPKGVNGSVFEIQRCWAGGPNGWWDTDLYPGP